MRAFTFAPRNQLRSTFTLILAVAAGGIALLMAGDAGAGEAVAGSLTSAPATHKQSKILKVADSAAGQKLEDFCIDSQGRILTLLGPRGANDAEPMLEVEGDNSTLGAISRLLGGKKKAIPHFDSAVHVYDSDGNLAEKWPVGFSGQAINTAPDGTILVGGNGRVARFDVEGKKLLEMESPQMTYINNNPDEMRERAKEQLESDRAMYADRVKQFEDQLEELKKSKKESQNKKKPAKSKKQVDDEEDDVGNQMNEANLKSYIQTFKQQQERLEKKTVEQALQEVMSRAKRINAIAGSQDEVFVTCPAMAGYGYGIWRTDQKFEQAKEIVKSLSGCCGQMDVQCHNNELYVCENSRHRVVRFDRDGNKVGQFGKRDREGEGENFGSCCNPMNLCFNKTGDLFVSESNGVVKHFTPDGKYKGVVGIARVTPGCKNSCVGVTADENRLFYIDIEKSQIIVLSKATESNETVSKK